MVLLVNNIPATALHTSIMSSVLQRFSGNGQSSKSLMRA